MARASAGVAASLWRRAASPRRLGAAGALVATAMEGSRAFGSRVLAAPPAARFDAARALPDSGKVIGTHSGGFQADEALGCWMLHQMPEYAGAKIVRSRDPAELDKCDIVIDVGGVYDLARLRFDHHQRGFFETVDGEVGKATGPESATGRWKTKLSASGLIYKHYGRGIIAWLAGLDEADTEAVWAEVYVQLMEGVDAIDNGIEVADGPLRYKEGSCLSSRVGRLNPLWNEQSDHDEQCRRFTQAYTLCGEQFLEVLGDIVRGWLPARCKVAEAIAQRAQVLPSGEVIQLESGGLPWRDVLYGLERDAGIEGVIKFVLFVDSSGMHRIQAVTKEGTLFTNRLSLPEPWRGLRDAELVAAAGIAGCKFVHATGFIGGADSFEGVLEMANRALAAGQSCA